MKTEFLKLKRQFTLLCILLGTFMSSVSIAIVQIEPLAADETPLLTQSLKQGHLEHYKRYVLNLNDPSHLEYFHFKVFGQEEAALRELILVQLQSGYNREDYTSRILAEFQRLQIDMLSRDFEPSTNSHWAPAKQLSIVWKENREFEFIFQLNYQKKGQTLEGHDHYPRVVLKGTLWYDCKNPLESAERFDDCSVSGAEIQTAGIEWHQIPGHRGGNSSAGGTTTTKEKLLATPLIIKDLPQLHKPSGLLFQIVKPQIPKPQK